MWRSDVTEPNTESRRHVGGILRLNKKYTEIFQGYSQTVYFYLCIIPHTYIVSSTRKVTGHTSDFMEHPPIG